MAFRKPGGCILVDIPKMSIVCFWLILTGINCQNSKRGSGIGFRAEKKRFFSKGSKFGKVCPVRLSEFCQFWQLIPGCFVFGMTSERRGASKSLPKLTKFGSQSLSVLRDYYGALIVRLFRPATLCLPMVLSFGSRFTAKISQNYQGNLFLYRKDINIFDYSLKYCRLVDNTTEVTAV